MHVAPEPATPKPLFWTACAAAPLWLPPAARTGSSDRLKAEPRLQRDAFLGMRKCDLRLSRRRENSAGRQTFPLGRDASKAAVRLPHSEGSRPRASGGTDSKIGRDVGCALAHADRRFGGVRQGAAYHFPPRWCAACGARDLAQNSPCLSSSEGPSPFGGGIRNRLWRSAPLSFVAPVAAPRAQPRIKTPHHRPGDAGFFRPGGPIRNRPPSTGRHPHRWERRRAKTGQAFGRNAATSWAHVETR